MENKVTKPRTLRGSMGSLSWFFQAFSGLFLVFFVGVHLYIAHVNFGQPVAFFREVLINIHDPLWLLFYIAFTWIVTFHALNGVKGVLYDMKLSEKGRVYVSYGLTILYFVTVIYGTVLAVIVAGIPIPSA